MTNPETERVIAAARAFGQMRGHLNMTYHDHEKCEAIAAAELDLALAAYDASAIEDHAHEWTIPDAFGGVSLCWRCGKHKEETA